MMPTKATINEQRKAGAAARLALLAGLLAAALAGPAAAASPWESIATMIRNKAANAATTATLTTRTATSARPAEAVPVLGGVPDEVAVTSGSQARVMGSAALALLKMTTGTVKVKPATGKKPSGGKGNDEKAIDLGRESDENEALLATNLFKNQDILRLLGDQPRFIYDPQNRPDPMIVPWVRRAAIFKELSALAEEYSSNNEMDKAVAVYQRILQMNDQRYNALIHEKLQAIADKQNAQAVALIQQTNKVVEEKIELPAWIQDNTTGVIVSPGEELCLVGEFMLHPGDKVPTYPEVTVASITSKKVIYQIRNRSFEVNLNTN